MKKRLFGLVMVLSLLGIGFIQATEYPKNIVNVSAVGDVSFKANIAYLTLGVENVYAHADEGQRDVNKKIKNFIADIQKLIKSKNIETTTITIRKKFDYINRKREFVGYEVKQILKLSISNFDTIGPLMDKGVNNGFNVVSSLRYSHTDYKKYKREALKNALLEADKKAMLISETMGLKSMKLSRVIESKNSYQPYMEKSAGMRALNSVSDSAPTKVYAGSLQASAGVDLEYSYSGVINKRQ